MTLWNFTPPTVYEGLQPWEEVQRQGRWDYRWSLYFMKENRGQSVWQDSGGTWHIGRFPTFDDVNQARWFYYGGQVSVVSDANKAAIIAAGLGIDSTYFTAANATATLTPPPHADNWQPMPPATNT